MSVQNTMAAQFDFYFRVTENLKHKKGKGLTGRPERFWTLGSIKSNLNLNELCATYFESVP